MGANIFQSLLNQSKTQQKKPKDCLPKGYSFKHLQDVDWRSIAFLIFFHLSDRNSWIIDFLHLFYSILSSLSGVSSMAKLGVHLFIVPWYESERWTSRDNETVCKDIFKYYTAWVIINGSVQTSRRAINRKISV